MKKKPFPEGRRIGPVKIFLENQHGFVPHRRVTLLFDRAGKVDQVSDEAGCVNVSSSYQGAKVCLSGTPGSAWQKIDDAGICFIRLPE